MDRKQKYGNLSAGHVDPDLSTDKHDEIMIWLDGKIEEYAKYCNGKVDRKVWEYPLFKGSREYKSIVGYIDILASITNCGVIAFEVKSHIKSVGELIRQIRQYQSFCNGQTKFIVVSPDDRFVDVLKNQGIDFWKYEENGETP